MVVGFSQLKFTLCHAIFDVQHVLQVYFEYALLSIEVFNLRLLKYFLITLLLELEREQVNLKDL